MKTSKIILFLTAGIFASIFIANYFFFRHGGWNQRVRVQTLKIFAANELDELEESIEIYRLKYGKYPDNLFQIKKENKSISIIDPISQFGFRSAIPRNFYYVKRGNSYIIFSSGIDGIPNTSDDIYPRKPIIK